MLLEAGEYTMEVFADIEGAFDKATFDSRCSATSRHRVDGTIIRWIHFLLSRRLPCVDCILLNCGNTLCCWPVMTNWNLKSLLEERTSHYGTTVAKNCNNGLANSKKAITQIHC